MEEAEQEDLLLVPFTEQDPELVRAAALDQFLLKGFKWTEICELTNSNFVIGEKFLSTKIREF